MSMDLPAFSLSRACRIFLALAYPIDGVPASKQAFLALQPDGPLEPYLCPPVCQQLIGTPTNNTELRGYAFRLGSSHFPHVKLQLTWHKETARWFFAVDTHDAIHLPPDDPDYGRFRELQAKNRSLKQQIEQAWEAEGILTFTGSLRQALGVRG